MWPASKGLRHKPVRSEVFFFTTVQVCLACGLVRCDTVWYLSVVAPFGTVSCVVSSVLEELDVGLLTLRNLQSPSLLP